MFFTRFFLVIPFYLATLVSYGQYLQGYATSNYAGTNSLYHNPAFVADSPYSAFVNLIGVNTYVGNNHIKWDAPFSLPQLITRTVSDEHRLSNGAVKFPRTYLEQKTHDQKRYLNTGVEGLLPSLQLNFKEGRIGVAFTSRARVIANLSNLTEPVAQLFTGTPQDINLHNQVYLNQSGDLQFNGVGEYALTLGGVLFDNGTDFLKIGVTTKRLIGVAHSHIYLKNANYELVPDPKWNGQRYMIQAENIQAELGYTTDLGIQSAGFNPSWLSGKSSPGKGLAFDIGAVYEYRPDYHKYGIQNGGKGWVPDRSKIKYLYRVAVSLTDVGRFGFNNVYYNVNQEIQNGEGAFPYNNYKNLGSVESFFNAIASDLTLPAPIPASYKTPLPTTFRASIDYAIKPSIYVNAMLVQNLKGVNRTGIRPESVLAITPRYEHRWYELSIPVSLMNNYRSLGIGLAGRVGPLWIGTDHITGLLNIGKPKAMTFYAGLSMGIFNKPLDYSLPCWPPKPKGIKRLFSKF